MAILPAPDFSGPQGTVGHIIEKTEFGALLNAWIFRQKNPNVGGICDVWFVPCKKYPEKNQKNKTDVPEFS